MDNDKLNQLEERIWKSKCAICGLLLSVGPLMVMSEDGSQIRCGRCKEIKCQTLARNILYEAIAEILTFPCSYEKCNEVFPWGQIEKHEKVCPFRTVWCPMYHQGCGDRIVEVANLQSHFTQAHVSNMKLGKINFKSNVTYDTIFLLVVDDLKFLVYLVLSSTDNFFIVFSLDPLGKFTKFNVQLRSDKNEDIFVSYVNQRIIHFNEREHCFKCLRKQCTLKYHPYSQAHENATSLDWETLYHKFDKRVFELLGNPKPLIITVDLIADQKQQGSEGSPQVSCCLCHKIEDERKEAAVDEKDEKIDLPS